MSPVSTIADLDGTEWELDAGDGRCRPSGWNAR
jgi:hypothetical protein